MPLYVKTFAGNMVAASTVSAEPPDVGWVEVSNPELASATLMDQAYVLDGTALVPTGQPKFPPHHWMTWSSQTNTWVDPRTQAQKTSAQWTLVRAERQQRLEASDWTDTASAPGRLGATLYQSWQTYRQALRDVTTQPDPFNITWPTPPN